MKIQRLGWAGIEIEADDQALVIDYVQDQNPMEPVLRSQKEPFPASSRPGDTCFALLTHLHADHADADALAAALRPGAPVFRPEPAAGSAEDVLLTPTQSKSLADVLWRRR